MAKLFLDGMFTSVSNSPSAVGITFPAGDYQYRKLVGLIIGDPTFSAQTKWGPVINDVSNLTDISALMGSPDLVSWISASTMCWKGTSPLSISIDFYLINYARGLNIESDLKDFVKLASLYQAAPGVFAEGARTQVHGGYAADIFKDNTDLFNGRINSLKDLKDNQRLRTIDDLSDSEGNIKNTVILKFGGKSMVRNLLLTRVNVTESTVEVADSSGNNRKPLYYRVSAQFTGAKPLISLDVDKMFEF